MVDVTGSARRLYHLIVGTRTKRSEPHPGVESIAAGHTAVAMTEAGMSEAVALGASYPALGFAEDFSRLGHEERVNLWGRPLSVLEASGPRGSLAEAMGLAMSGMRATAFVSGTDLSEGIDLLSRAAGRRLPLVVQLAARAQSGHGSTGGGGHALLHAAGETGAMVLVAANVQEAVDFSLLAHRSAEDALVPVVVAMDGEETALSVQDLRLPDPHVVRRFVGDPDENIHPPAPSQGLLFGKHRRRVPRWHDPERPFLTGPSEGPLEFALGEAGRFAYLDSHMSTLLENALVEFDAETGRLHAPVSEYRVKDAEFVLVGMGAVVESLEAIVDHVRRTTKIKVGAVGIRVLRPFPAARIVELLRGRTAAAVLERVSSNPDSHPPLVRDIQVALENAHQNARYGPSTHPGVPAVDAKDLPRLATVFYGLGGSAIRSADLSALCVELSTGFRSPIFLGLTFSPAQSEYPKRQVLLDALKRHYPDSENLGLRGDGDGVPASPNTLCVSFHRMTGRGGEELAGQAATMLYGLVQGHVRSRRAPVWDRWGAVSVDRLLIGADTVRDSGDDAEAQVLVWVGDALPPADDLTRCLGKGGAVLLERDPDAGPFLETLPAKLRRDVRDRNLKLYVVAKGEGANRDERLLGALVGLLQKEGRIEIKTRQLLALRRDALEDLDETERESRVTQLRAGFDLVMPVETGGLKKTDTLKPQSADVEAPRVVRRLRRTDDAGDSLARFWDQVGVLYRRGETEELAPDPYLGAGVMPPLSSSFRDLSFARDMFPAFDPSRCTGCGDCWSACPDSSMTPLVIGAGKLIETGMTLAKQQGRSADALRMVVSKLAARANAVLAENPADANAGAVLEEAFLRLMKKTPLPEEKKKGVKEAFGVMREMVSQLPLARTGPFFDEPETDKNGTGELFSLAMSPDACKGCALCVAVCEPHALSSLPEDASRSREARKLWELFEALPDPTDATLERAREHDTVGPVAAAMLTREVRESFAGGDGAEPGSGEKIALREILAVAYSRLMPRYREHVESVETLRDRLSEGIRDRMAKALPTGDLDALSEGLSAVDRPDINLADLSERIETAFDSGHIDVPELQRLVESARDVNDLHWHLTQGEGGLGRTPFGILFGAGSAAAWASTFPNNPFGVPVAVDSGGETPEMAMGILEGQLQGATRAAGALRRAHLELTDPQEAARSADATRRLAWRDLSAEERSLVPPLFLVMSESGLGRGLGGLSRLLSGDLPVKVVVLADVNLGVATAPAPLSPADSSMPGPAELGLLAVAHGNAFVAQTSVADPAHLDQCVADALTYDGPSLLRVHAPSPERHGFPKDMAVTRAKEAVRSRAFPVFRFEPGKHPFQVVLDGNPHPEADWVHADDGSPVTPAHWALEETRFSRTSSDEMTRAVEAALETWQTLQRLGQQERGQEADVVEAEPVRKLEEQHAAELAAIQQQYEARLHGLSAELKVDVARKVRGRLLALLQRRTNDGGGTATATADPEETGQTDPSEEEGSA